ncbi:MAG TPA: hypothetical protein DCE71_05245, partial [Parachlamydiales bacterium]|nr:hypothetical protein [Parachlamydiales bacterium]
MSIEKSYPTSVNWPTLKESKDVKENEHNALSPKISQKLCSAATYDALLKEGLFEEALQAAEEIAVIYRRTNALVDICKALTQRGHIDKAMEIARKEYPAPSYNTICNELLAMGEIDRAIEFANINSSSYLSNEWAYKNICKALTNAGRLDQSLQL